MLSRFFIFSLLILLSTGCGNRFVGDKGSKKGTKSYDKMSPYKINDKWYSDCSPEMIHTFRICITVKCPEGHRNNIRENIKKDDLTGDKIIDLRGAFIEGANIVCKVRDSIQKFNKDNISLATNKNYNFTNLKLTKIYEPIGYNGILIHCLEYKTKINN